MVSIVVVPAQAQHHHRLTLPPQWIAHVALAAAAAAAAAAVAAAADAAAHAADRSLKIVPWPVGPLTWESQPPELFSP